MCRNRILSVWKIHSAFLDTHVLSSKIVQNVVERNWTDLDSKQGSTYYLGEFGHFTSDSLFLSSHKVNFTCLVVLSNKDNVWPHFSDEAGKFLGVFGSMLGSMGGHGINTRHVPSASVLFNGRSFAIYFYIKPNKELLLSGKENLLPFLKHRMIKNFEDSKQLLTVCFSCSPGIYFHFHCIQVTAEESYALVHIKYLALNLAHSKWTISKCQYLEFLECVHFTKSIHSCSVRYYIKSITFKGRHKRL